VDGAVVVGFLDDVAVVACSSYDARVGPVSPALSAAFVDLGGGFGECSFPVVRGKSPPAR
jgi:hypothetical protein